GLDLPLGVVEVSEDLRVEALVAEAALERLDEAVFRGLARRREVELHAALVGPDVERLRSELRPVVRRDHLGQATCGRLVEQLCDACAGEAGARLKHLT